MSKRPRMAFPRTLSSVACDTLKISSPLATRLQEAEIWRVWRSVVGDVIFSKARPLRINNGNLVVIVSSSPWLQELRFMAAMMKDKLNNALGNQIVGEITFKQGRLPVDIPEEDEPDPPLQELSSDQQQYIDEQSAAITDPETRYEFQELMKSALQATQTRVN